MTTDNATSLLSEMGTNAAKWAAEFVRIIRAGDIDLNDLAKAADDDEGWMITWFANAIEAGRTAGRRETCPHPYWFTIATGITTCHMCGTHRDMVRS